MLQDKLSGRKLILASGSPRRKELLAGLGLDFTIDTRTDFEEIVPDGLPLEEVPEYMAQGKSMGFHRALEDNEILITADTMVLCKGEIMGKPKDAQDARRMLEKLQDGRHSVLTGVCIRSNASRKTFTAETDVVFGKLDTEEIGYYISNYKPFDKAGAYAVQEWIGFAGIREIRGSYFNVVGLPVQRLYTELKSFIAD